jgi:hypothetical protein
VELGDDIYGAAKLDPSRDKSGRGSKNALSGCFITFDSGRGFGLQYALLVGHIDLNPAHTMIGIPIHGAVRLEGWETHDANYLITVKGRNLEIVAVQLTQHKRESLHRSVGAEGKEASVDSITIEKMED